MKPLPVLPVQIRTVDEAIAALLDSARPISLTEWVETSAAIGRVLADDLQAGIDLPPFDNSAVDGYAFAISDMLLALDNGLAVDGRYAAGDAGGALIPGTTARVFTGSSLPAGANCVAMQEDCITGGRQVRILRQVKAQENIRHRGEDLAAGDVVLRRGVRLRPQDLGVVAALGCAKLHVYKRMRVAVLCTGNELAAPGERLAPGRIHDANGIMLAGLLQSLGCIVSGIDRIRDDVDATARALIRLAVSADVVITSGGVSAGEEDHIRPAIARCGRMEWWKVAIKPGKPFAFGRIMEKPLLALPGNPTSAFVTFCILARPFLLRMQGIDEVLPRGFPTPARFSRPPGKRREYLRTHIEGSGSDRGLILSGPQGSGVLSTAARAQGLAVVPEDTGVCAGDVLDYYSFDQLLA